ncbi:MAG TPA: glycoside hydrolase family 3 C-terminal domain-containing protein [Pelobium sp.]
MSNVRKKIRWVCLGLGILLLPAAAVSQVKPIAKYLDTKLSTEQRVHDLVSKLSLNQKVSLMMYTSTAIDSAGLKVPTYNWWNECLHGVARAGKATVFPQTIALAATWNNNLIFNVANSISDEARAKYNYFQSINQKGIYRGLNYWTPNINIFRDPRWGRGMETYGEDPYLTGQLASSFIKGIQGNNPKYFKAIATVKHFAVHSGPEETRHSINVNISDHDLYDTYTPAFKTCIQDAKAYSLMCAYNRFRDVPCCGNSFLLNDLLRKKWGFKGFVVTDCGAMDDFYTKGAHEVSKTPAEADALAIKAGVDLECGNVFTHIPEAIQKGYLTENDLNVALERLFTARFKLGFFDDSKLNPYNAIPYNVVESKEHQQLALMAAQQAAVLLKNNNNILPLSKSVKKIAVIGPAGNDAKSVLANYHGFPSKPAVTPFEGIKSKFSTAQVVFERGSGYTNEVPYMDLVPSKVLFTDQSCSLNGLKASYYTNSKFSGKPAFTKVDTAVNAYWIADLPAPNFNREDFSVRWEGFLKAPEDGIYSIGMDGFDNYKLFIDDSLIVKLNATHEPNTLYKKINFTKGKVYKLKVELSSTNSAPYVQLRWEKPNQNLKDKAIAAAKNADVVVLCMGLSPQLEGEEMPLEVDGFNKGDRTKLNLPLAQSELIKAIAELGKPTILTLLNGSALAINWEKEHIDGILEAWYGGQQAGNAIANILAGDYNPAGRLPVTFYKSENQLPDFENYDMKERTYRYFTGEPLFKFGFGLSYTTFNYSNLLLNKIVKVGDNVNITVTVKNTGNQSGDEVVQLYVKNSNKPEGFAQLSLKKFKRIHLQKGEATQVKFTLTAADFSEIFGSTREARAGKYTISIGGKQPENFAEPNVLQQQVELVGNTLKLAL